MSTEKIEQTFEVTDPACLRVSNIRGKVDVRPGEGGVIHVVAEKHTKTGSSGKTKIIIEQQDDGEVLVEAKYENSVASWFGLNKPCRVDFIIRVPQACSVKLNAVSSDVTVTGLNGNIDVNSVSGDLKLSDLNGEFNFSSVSGKITAENLAGPLEMNNVSGKVDISNSQIPAMIGKTVSGGVRIQTPLSDGPYQFKTVSGKLILLPPEDQGCVVSLKSLSGSVHTSLPVTESHGHGANKQLTILDGGPEVHVKSVSGSLRIGDKTAKTVDEPAVKPAPPAKSQMQILEEIETGELSVEDALELMNT